jgi:serine/threonine-protein kinase RsbW
MGGAPPGPAGAGDRIEIRLPSRADYLGAVRSVVRGFVEECLAVRLPEDQVNALQIALQEACINVVRHAHKGDASKPLVVGVRALPDRLEIEVEDFGPGLPPPEERPPDPDPENPREGGYGLFILRETMDEVVSERRDGKHVLRLVKRLPPRGATA